MTSGNKSYTEEEQKEVDEFVGEVHNKILKKCVKCSKCKKPMIFVYHESIRDTCTPCGGKSLRDSTDRVTNEKQCKLKENKQ